MPGPCKKVTDNVFRLSRTLSEDFDMNNDGKVTKKEVNKYLLKNMAMLKMIMGDQPAKLKKITKSLKAAATDMFVKADKDKSKDLNREESVPCRPPARARARARPRPLFDLSTRTPLPPLPSGPLP